MAESQNRVRGEGGRYVETITAGDIQDTVAAIEGPATAREVAEALGCSREAAYKKLDALADDGRIGKKKVGARAVVWYLPD